MGTAQALTSTDRAFLLAIAPRIAPAAAEMPPGGRDDDGVAHRRNARLAPAGDGAPVRLFLSVLRWAPALRYLRPFDRLDGPPRRTPRCAGSWTAARS